MDADFIGNSMAGLNNGVVPIEKEGCTSNVVVPVGFPNTNSIEQKNEPKAKRVS